MKFDYTHGKEATHIVGIYTETTDDHYYFSDQQSARDFLMKAGKDESHLRLSLYDIKNDVRDNYYRVAISRN